MGYTINTAHVLANAEGDMRRTSGKMIVLHSTDNLDASAENNAIFEKNNWDGGSRGSRYAAYVHFIVGDGVVFQVGTPGYVAWGAGQTANGLAPVQVEMEEASDPAKQKRIYATYIALVRDMAAKYGVPLTLDASGPTGIKTHDWCSRTYHETTHTDPWAALARIGVDRAQLASDLAHGVGAVTATKSAATSASKPAATAKPASSSGSWIKESGEFTVTSSNGIILRSGSPSVSSPVLAGLDKGQVVKYDAYCYAGGYVWIRQPRSDKFGYGYLPTGNATGQKRTSYWGTFR